MLGTLWSGVAAADGGRDCWAVYQAGSDQEQSGHLRDAESIFQNCALDSCGSPVRQMCEAKLFRLGVDAPSVVPLVNDPTGAPVVDASVSMDGSLLATRLDGRAIVVDPGVHTFVFSAGEVEIGKQTLVIVQGQRNRELAMTLPSPEPEPAASEVEAAPALELPAQAAASVEPVRLASRASLVANDPPRSHSLTPYLLGGTAVLGAGAYALLSTWARGDNRELGRCSPNCSPDAVSHIRTLYVAADISLGVAAAAALGSVATFVFGGSSVSEESAPRRSVAVTVQPERSGALATIRGTL